MIAIKIDSEFEALIQPLTSEEFDLLRSQVLRDGCRESLSVWKTDDGNRIMLDGHNRYKICTESQRDFQITNFKFDSREPAKLWILEHQVGRRNLTDDQRAIMWNEIREARSKVATLEAAAKARAAKVDSAKSTESEPGVEPSESKKDTRADVAKEAKIPESKLRAVHIQNE